MIYRDAEVVLYIFNIPTVVVPRVHSFLIAFPVWANKISNYID
jgi:hypothetical protein